MLLWWLAQLVIPSFSLVQQVIIVSLASTSSIKVSLSGTEPSSLKDGCVKIAQDGAIIKIYTKPSKWHQKSGTEKLLNVWVPTTNTST